MRKIQRIDYIGIRINDIDISIVSYESLGFEKTLDAGFKSDHP